MTPRKMRASGSVDTYAPTYASALDDHGRPARVIRDGRGNLLGHAIRRPGSGRPSWRVITAARAGELGVVPSLPWAAILLEQHRATGRRQRSGRFALEVIDT